MPRFYVISQEISGLKITITDKGRVHHMHHVLRLKEKAEVVFFDDKFHEYKTEIVKSSPESIVLKIKEKKKIIIIEKARVTVACAMPKNSKIDDIIDKLTQLGVDRVIPLKTERVIVNLDDSKKEARLMRWRKIARSAAIQSQRNNFPVIEPVKDIREVLAESGDFDLKLIPTLLGERQSLKNILTKPKYKNILVLIGPEGDFTPQEVSLAKQAGCIAVSLGDLVLRVETAAIAAAGFIRFYADD
jgi:16S rRNA (uracil1498-N3)-methyltransferase